MHQCRERRTRGSGRAWGNKRSQVGDSWNRFSFTGYEEDTETGLLYAKARFYDPDTGLFISQDAWEGDVNTPPSLHKYLYAYQNPTVWVDPTGNTPVFVGEDEHGNTSFSQFGSPGDATIRGDIDVQARQRKEREQIDRFANPACGSSNPPSYCVLADPEVVEAIWRRNNAQITSEDNSSPIGDPTVREYQERKNQVRARMRSELQRVEEVADIAIGIVYPPKGYFDLYENRAALTDFVRNNPEVTLSAAAATACKAISRCWALVKGVASDVSAKVKGGGRGPDTKVLSKAERLEIQKALQTRVSDIRAELPKKLRGSGNVGVAQLDIKGLPSELRAHSRINYSADKGADGFVHLADESDWVFKPKAVDPDNVRLGTPDAYSRQWDTEFKILNDVALRLGNNRNVTGSINLFTERLTCTSCTDVIFEFRARYPNVQLNVFAGE